MNYDSLGVIKWYCKVGFALPFNFIRSLISALCLLLDIVIRKVKWIKILHKTLKFWREIQIKDIHQREDKTPAQSLTTTTLVFRCVIGCLELSKDG